MKKKFALGLAVCCVLSMAGCSSNSSSTDSSTADTSVEDTKSVESSSNDVPSSEEASSENTSSEEASSEESSNVLSYADYVAAELDTEVTIEAYVQAKQSWWEDKATLYTQDKDGAYFIYNCACSEEDYAKLVPGTKIRVTGFKSEWSGEVEIIDVSSLEILDSDTYIADAVDVTELLGKDELIDYQNQLVSFNNMVVEPANDAGDAYLYKWDGSGEEGDDLYFNVSSNGATYTFTVESYLCDSSSDVYKAVKNLKVGDHVNLEGFLYWYEGVNPHITSLELVK